MNTAQSFILRHVALFVWVLSALLWILGACEARRQKPEVQDLGTPPEEITAVPDSVFDLQGHRGARGLLPENSLPGFIKAIDLGVQTLELDVVVSKDKKIVLSHEPFFSPDICRSPQGDSISPGQERQFNIYNYTVEEIRDFDCGRWGNARFPEQKKMAVYKPTLAEVVDSVERYIRRKQLPPVYYNIETKSRPEDDSIFHPKPEEFAQLLYQELKSLSILDKVLIQSFDVRTLQVFKKLDEEVRLVLLVQNPQALETSLRSLGFTPSVYSPYYIGLTEGIVRKAHEKGMKVIPWTVNDLESMRKLIRMGVDGLITDYPDRFQQLRAQKEKSAPK
ncbi:MAG: glycerophosphodiester phosphodiesterase [Microscillaceae bacterium]|nr:glycerophosphodiester phosphodiesterase [Microscillaceae bacterium]